MTSPRSTHIASSVAYIALALIVAGVVLAPRDILPSIGLSSLTVETFAQEAADNALKPSKPTPDRGGDDHESDPATDGLAVPSVPEVAESSPNPIAADPTAAACVSGDRDCSAAEMLELLMPGAVSPPSMPPKDDVLPGDETVSSSEPTPTDTPTTEPTTDTTEESEGTDAVPADSAEEPSTQPSDSAEGEPSAEPSEEPSPEPSPGPSPEPSPGPSPEASPEPSPDATPSPTKDADAPTPKDDASPKDDPSKGATPKDDASPKDDPSKDATPKNEATPKNNPSKDATPTDTATKYDAPTNTPDPSPSGD